MRDSLPHSLLLALVCVAFTAGCEHQVTSGEPAPASEPEGEPESEPASETPEPTVAPPEPGPTEPDTPGPEAEPSVCTQETLAAFAATLEAAVADLPGGGGAVALICADGTLLSQGVGVTQQGGTPVDGNTLFQLASVSKALTAATGVLLDQDGVVDLNAPVGPLLAGIDVEHASGTEMTLSHLLAHRSGYTTAGLFGGQTLEALFAANPAVPLWAEPGRVYNYSNYGYALAGLAIERAGTTSGADDFGDVVTQRLLAPHEIDMVFGAAAATASGNVAFGHNGSGDVFGPSDSYYGAPWYAPMGGAFGSAESLGAFAALLLGGGGSDGAALRERMSAPQIRTDLDARTFYGQGLFVDESGNTPMWMHGGGVEGFGSHFVVFPERGAAAVILVNQDTAEIYPSIQWANENVGQWEYEWEPASPLTGVTGTYVDPYELGTITIAEGATGLEATFVDLGFTAPLELWDEDTAIYFHSPYSMDVTLLFWRDETGNVDLLSTWDGVATRQ